jgi:DNA-binding MarR family transcriptional regulator
MVEDVVRELGYLTLGTRLKRIGERLQGQAQPLFEAAGIDLPAAHFPLLAALARLGPLSVGEIAAALGTSQPGVTRLLKRLARAGLVSAQPAASDRRVRAVALSRAGRELISRCRKRSWPQIEAAVAEACAGPAAPLLAQLTALEEALALMPLQVRAARGGRRGRVHGRA